MNSQSYSTTRPDLPEADRTPSDSGRKRLIKIKRSSGKYEYVTREQLEELNKQAKQRSHTKNIRKKISRLTVIAVAILGCCALLVYFILRTAF